MPPWENPLLVVSACLAGASHEAMIPFLVVGSVASEMQGCMMGTRDLDILLASEDDLKQYTSRVARYLHEPETAISCQSFDSGFKWYKAQHDIDGFIVDAVYIASGGGIPDSITGDGAWEGGPFAWRFARKVQFQQYEVQVAPLEIQLESQIRRGRTDRTDFIAQRLRTIGCDTDLLRQCLSRDSFAMWEQMVK